MMNKIFKDFWINSGWHLLKDRGSIGLIPNEDYMKAYFLRPELELVKESCQAEKELRSKLIENPFYIVKDDELLSMKDKDAIENYKAVLSFRDFLSQSINLEEAYLKIANGEKFFFPPMFLDQIVQIILKEILKSEEDPMILRVAEIFFRTQNVTLDDGKIMIADSSTVQTLYDQQNINRSDNMVKEVQLDILTSETKEIYWERSDNFDTSVDIAYTQPALDSLARVLEKWVMHFLGVKLEIKPMVKIEDKNWSWHIGLDSESTEILNALYNGSTLSEEKLKQILCLFKIEPNKSFAKNMKNKPIYLALSMSPRNIITFKPQNLLVNLPLEKKN